MTASQDRKEPHLLDLPAGLAVSVRPGFSPSQERICVWSTERPRPREQLSIPALKTSYDSNNESYHAHTRQSCHGALCWGPLTRRSHLLRNEAARLGDAVASAGCVSLLESRSEQAHGH